VGDGTRTHDVQIHSLATDSAQPQTGQTSPKSRKRRPDRALTSNEEFGPELARLVDAWPALSKAKRQTILSILEM
jgi:hypothetical protein